MIRKASAKTECKYKLLATWHDRWSNAPHPNHCATLSQFSLSQAAGWWILPPEKISSDSTQILGLAPPPPPPPPPRLTPPSATANWLSCLSATVPVPDPLVEMVCNWRCCPCSVSECNHPEWNNGTSGSPCGGRKLTVRSAAPSAVQFPEKASHIAVPMRVCVCVCVGGGGGGCLMKKQEMSIQVPRLFLLLFLSNPHCVGFTSVDSEPDKTEGRLCHSPRGEKVTNCCHCDCGPFGSQPHLMIHVYFKETRYCGMFKTVKHCTTSRVPLSYWSGLDQSVCVCVRVCVQTQKFSNCICSVWHPVKASSHSR